VKGKISIVSETPIKVDDAWRAFLTALDMKGFTIIPSGEYLRIERSQAAKEKQVPIYAGKFTPDTDEYITRILPLKYISAKEVENTFRLWIPRQGRMYAHEQTNTIIITDTAAHIRSFIELIGYLDVSGFQESLAVIPIKNAVAKDLAKMIEQILYGTGGQKGGARSARPQGFSAPRPGGFGAEGREGSSSISQIIADERTNSLVVKANRAGLDEIRSLIQKLDTHRAQAEGSGRIHVVRLQFANAEDIAKSLGAIVKDKASPNSRSTGGFPPPPGAPQDPVATLFQGEIKVSPDVTTQSLVITASPQDFQTLKKVIEQLDIPRDQVHVEAIIMEMNLQNTEGYGVSVLNLRNGIAFPSQNLAKALLNDPNPGLSLGFRQGSTLEVTTPSGKVQVPSLAGLIELLQSTGNTNVVARPHLMALDNEEAEVEISDEIPLPQTTQSTIGQTTGFTKDKASLKLKVKPHINKASDFVRLEIEQTLEEFNTSIVPREVQGKAAGKSGRSTKTQVVVQNEDTVVLSGLIRDKVEETTNKVPLLGDIPVLGWLFKNSSIKTTKSDLVIFITPRIVKQYDKIRTILGDRVKERGEFVNENLGGNDPQIGHMRKMKARLPDLSKLKPLPTGAATGDSASFSAPTRNSDDDAGGSGGSFPPSPFGDFPPPPVMPPIESVPPPFDPPPGGDFGAPPPEGGDRF
jgi:general secretion pathway protein D